MNIINVNNTFSNNVIGNLAEVQPTTKELFNMQEQIFKRQINNSLDKMYDRNLIPVQEKIMKIKTR